MCPIRSSPAPRRCRCTGGSGRKCSSRPLACTEARSAGVATPAGRLAGLLLLVPGGLLLLQSECAWAAMHGAWASGGKVLGGIFLPTTHSLRQVLFRPYLRHFYSGWPEGQGF